MQFSTTVLIELEGEMTFSEPIISSFEKKND